MEKNKSFKVMVQTDRRYVFLRIAIENNKSVIEHNKGFGGIPKFAMYRNHKIFYYNLIEEFDYFNCEEVTLEEAIKIIENDRSIEIIDNPNAPTGQWVEFDIVNGFYTLANGAKIRWQDYVGLESAGYLFGGWYWKHDGNEFWSLTRQGIYNKDITKQTNYCSDWSMPLIPTKIRFWKGE